MADLSAETGARAAVIEDAVRDQEVVVVALPINKIPSLPRELFSATPADVALAVAGDAARSKSKAMALIDGIGFDAVDAGVIAQSWRQQPGSPGYLQDYDVKGESYR